MKKIKWGILSTANIGQKHVIPALQQCENAAVIAIASRSLTKAQEVGKKLNIPKAYGSYEDLLADPEVEAIYNPLPNHLHVPLTIKALHAGKHVLCEKPIAMDANEAAFLQEVANQYPKLKLMEGFMYRHYPLWKFVKDQIAAGFIGELRNIHSVFSYFNADPDNVRNQSDIGGGGLMDVGCYPISLSRWLFDTEPLHVSANIELDPLMETDRLASGMLQFKTGVSLFTCSTQMVPFQRAIILGTTGGIEVDIPFNAPSEKPTRLLMFNNGGKEEVIFDPINPYILQGTSFSQSILEDTPVFTPIEDAVNNMKVIDALFASAAKGERVVVL